MHMCTQTCTHACTYMCLHASMHTRAYMHKHIHGHAHTCTHTHAHTHAQTHTHTHTHTEKKEGFPQRCGLKRGVSLRWSVARLSGAALKSTYTCVYITVQVYARCAEKTTPVFTLLCRCIQGVLRNQHLCLHYCAGVFKVC